MSKENPYAEYMRELLKDPAGLKKFMRTVMGLPHRELEGEEYNHVKLMLALLDPYQQTNNQRSITDYMLGNIKYCVIYWPDSDPTIAEYLPE
jgi:hypothetical protein